VLWQSDYDPRLGALTNSSLSVDYRWHKYFASAGNNIARTDPVSGSASQDGYRANEYRFRVGFGDPNNRGWNAAFDGIYDRRLSELKYSTTQVTYNTDCCGFSIQLHRYRVGLRDDTTWRVAFMIANIGSFGTLRKQDRLF
jgi:LPS-assembly protein